MSLFRKGLILGLVHCLIVLSLAGKLVHDRATRPRVWVKTAPWDPSLPIRGSYLALLLAPETGAPCFAATGGQRVLFFVPEHTLPFETGRRGRDAPELRVEVTIPKKGPPRPIQLGLKKAGQIEPLAVN